MSELGYFELPSDIVITESSVLNFPREFDFSDYEEPKSRWYNSRNNDPPTDSRFRKTTDEDYAKYIAGKVSKESGVSFDKIFKHEKFLSFVECEKNVSANHNVVADYTEFKTSRMKQLEPRNMLWSEITGLEFTGHVLDKQIQDIDHIHHWNQPAETNRKRSADQMQDD